MIWENLITPEASDASALLLEEASDLWQRLRTYVSGAWASLAVIGAGGGHDASQSLFVQIDEMELSSTLTEDSSATSRSTLGMLLPLKLNRFAGIFRRRMAGPDSPFATRQPSLAGACLGPPSNWRVSQQSARSLTHPRSRAPTPTLFTPVLHHQQT